MTTDFDDETTDEFDEQFDADQTAASPLTAEAVRLVTSLQDWVRRTAVEAQAQDGHTGPDCQWCPLCQFVAVLRGERPEVTERVAEAGVAITAALRSLLDATASAAQGGAHRAEERDEPAEDDPAPRVQHIKLGDDLGTTGTE